RPSPPRSGGWLVSNQLQEVGAERAVAGGHRSARNPGASSSGFLFLASQRARGRRVLFHESRYRGEIAPADLRPSGTASFPSAKKAHLERGLQAFRRGNFRNVLAEEVLRLSGANDARSGGAHSVRRRQLGLSR